MSVNGITAGDHESEYFENKNSAIFERLLFDIMGTLGGFVESKEKINGKLFLVATHSLLIFGFKTTLFSIQLFEILRSTTWLLCFNYT